MNLLNIILYTDRSRLGSPTYWTSSEDFWLHHNQGDDITTGVSFILREGWVQQEA